LFPATAAVTQQQSSARTRVVMLQHPSPSLRCVLIICSPKMQPRATMTSAHHCELRFPLSLDGGTPAVCVQRAVEQPGWSLPVAWLEAQPEQHNHLFTVSSNRSASQRMCYCLCVQAPRCCGGLLLSSCVAAGGVWRYPQPNRQVQAHTTGGGLRHRV
jgi:hypothetical protein